MDASLSGYSPLACAYRGIKMAECRVSVSGGIYSGSFIHVHFFPSLNWVVKVNSLSLFFFSSFPGSSTYRLLSTVRCFDRPDDRKGAALHVRAATRRTGRADTERC